MIRKTKADAEREKKITCLHESAHVVLAILSGRRVQWVTVKPKRVVINGISCISLGRWDVADKRVAGLLNIEERKQHIHTTMAGPVAENMITHKGHGGEDMDIAFAYCKEWNLNFNEMMRETALIIHEHAEEINRLVDMLMEHKTLHEDQIKQAIFQ
jgi:ATP-dependent Zn protease